MCLFLNLKQGNVHLLWVYRLHLITLKRNLSRKLTIEIALRNTLLAESYSFVVIRTAHMDKTNTLQANHIVPESKTGLLLFQHVFYFVAISWIQQPHVTFLSLITSTKGENCDRSIYQPNPKAHHR